MSSAASLENGFFAPLNGLLGRLNDVYALCPSVNGSMVCQRQVSMNGRIPTDASDIVDFFGIDTFKRDELTPDVFYRVVGSVESCGVAELGYYASEFSTSLLRPRLSLKSLPDTQMEEYATKVSEALVGSPVVDQYVEGTEGFREVLREVRNKATRRALGNAATSAASLCYIDCELFQGEASRIFRKVTNALRSGLIPIGWRGSYTSGDVVVFG